MHSDKITSPFTDVSLRTAAIVAGLALLGMAILAPFVQFGVLQSLIVPGDAQATAAHIRAASGLFRAGIGGFLIVAILDVVVAWALYVLLKPVNQSLSLLAAWLRVVYAALFAGALTNLFQVLQLLTGADLPKAFDVNQLYAQALLASSAFQAGWDIALAVFGLHLLVVGYLALRSRYIPFWLGILLVIAGLGYAVDSFGKLMLPTYNLSIAAFTFVGEVVLIIWLLWKGFKGFDERLEQQ